MCQYLVGASRYVFVTCPRNILGHFVDAQYHGHERRDDRRFETARNWEQILLFTCPAQSVSPDPVVCEKRRGACADDPTLKRGQN